MSNSSDSGILWENEKLVFIVIGKSSNVKTGNIPQTYILRKDRLPTTAVKDGSDSAICGNCPLRGKNGKGRSCYVTVVFGPNNVWKTYKKGGYEKIEPEVFEDRIFRIGSYGDPGFLPIALIDKIKDVTKQTLGYSHLWRKKPKLAGKIMASVETVKGKEEANKMGFKTFRTIRDVSEKLPDEVVCPASPESGKKLTCVECQLCTGNKKDACIVGHGSKVSAGKHIKTLLNKLNE